MIERSNLHALIIAAPDDLHFQMTMDALDAGLHVLCEKPLALNAKRAKQMYEKAKTVGVKHMVYFTWRWLPHFQYMKFLIDEGYIGDCFHSLFRYVVDYGLDGQYKWRFDQERANGILGDLGSHMIDLARWSIGEIVKVNAHISTFVKRKDLKGGKINPANDSAMLTLQFKNGVQGFIHVSAVSHVGDRVQEQLIILNGNSGTLEINTDLLSRSEIYGIKKDEKSFRLLTVPDQFWEGVQRSTSFKELQDVFSTQSVGTRLFIDAILKDQQVSPNFLDGLKVQEVIDAALASHHSGSLVTLA
jgi:predicted dehydrogenase